MSEERVGVDEYSPVSLDHLMVYLDPQVDSSGTLLGAVDCLDESPTGPALRRVLSESPGGAASGALQDRVLGILLSTNFTVGECLTPGEYRAMGLSAVWDYDTMLCVIEGAGGSAAGAVLSWVHEFCNTRI